MSSAYTKQLLVEWGRADRGEIRGPLGFRTSRYAERIGTAFRIDDGPLVNPDVARIGVLVGMLPPAEYAAMRLRYREGRPIADICRQLDMTRDAVHDRIAAATRLLEHWLVLDRGANGLVVRAATEITKAVTPKASAAAA